MFSLDQFYNILHNNLIAPVFGKSAYFYPFGTYEQIDILDNTKTKSRFTINCIFADQEPYYDTVVPILLSTIKQVSKLSSIGNITLLANSEQSDFKNSIIQNQKMYNWYYFYHGFAALDWYKDFRYVTQDSFNQFDKVFICLNHLTTKYRAHRLHLVSNLIKENLIEKGVVSLFHHGWQEVISDSDCPLDSRARVQIYRALQTLDAPLIADTDSPSGTMSATVDLKQLNCALWHIVTETVYFQPKLHLTEKIFKPIVSQKPFILVGAPGNLAYLKSYGFQTFDRWIDESYDQEQDHYIRIEKITTEIVRLCAMSHVQLTTMHEEMKSILLYNYQHFYTTFKDRLVDELVDNFSQVLQEVEQTRNRNLLPTSPLYNSVSLPLDYLQEVKKRLKQ